MTILIDVALGIVGIVAYLGFGLLTSVGLARAFGDDKSRRAIAERRYDTATWFTFGTTVVLWPLALAIAGLWSAVVYPAKLIAKSASYLMKTLEP